MGENGEVSTYTAERGGRAVELPMLRSEAGVPPPCHVCPKVAGREEKAPLPPDDDYGPWFWGLREWYEGGAAVGFDRPPAFLRRVAAAFRADERERQARQLASVAAALVPAARRE